MSNFNKKACIEVMASIRELRDSLVKRAFLPMPGDMPPGAAPAAPSGPPQDPSAGGPPPGADPSGGAGGPPPGPDPSAGGAGAPPPPGADPSAGGPLGMDPSQSQGDPNSQAMESILQGMQELAETVQQLGTEFDKRIADVQKINDELKLTVEKQQQDLDQLAQAHEETGQSVQEILPFIQSMQQPAPMDGSVQNGQPQQGLPPGNQSMASGGGMGDQGLPGMALDGGTPADGASNGDGLGPAQGDPMAMGQQPQGMPQVQG